MNPLDVALLRFSFKILRKKRTSMWRRCCLRQNWNQAVHTEHIFIAFSGGTSITVALASRTKPCKINASSTFKKTCLKTLAIFPHPTASHVFKWKSTLCDWFSVLCIKLYVHTWCCFVSNCLSNLIIYGL